MHTNPHENLYFHKSDFPTVKKILQNKKKFKPTHKQKYNSNAHGFAAANNGRKSVGQDNAMKYWQHFSGNPFSCSQFQFCIVL